MKYDLSKRNLHGVKGALMKFEWTVTLGSLLVTVAYLGSFLAIFIKGSAIWARLSERVSMVERIIEKQSAVMEKTDRTLGEIRDSVSFMRGRLEK